MKSSIKDFFTKCDQIQRKLRIWSHLLKKSIMENFIFCAVIASSPLQYLLVLSLLPMQYSKKSLAMHKILCNDYELPIYLIFFFF